MYCRDSCRREDIINTFNINGKRVHTIFNVTFYFWHFICGKLYIPLADFFVLIL